MQQRPKARTGSPKDYEHILGRRFNSSTSFILYEQVSHQDQGDMLLASVQQQQQQQKEATAVIISAATTTTGTGAGIRLQDHNDRL